MPRSNLCVSRNQKRYEYVSAVLFTGLTVRHISDQQASDKMGVSLRTLQNRKAKPEALTLQELYKLADMAGVKITFEPTYIPD